MQDKTSLSFSVRFTEAFEKYNDKNALCFVGETPITYKELSNKINALIHYLEKLGISSGDKVAILSNNMPNWGIAYLSIVLMNAVAVPLLPDFSESEIDNILTHSESKAIFVSSNLKHKLDACQTPFLETRLMINDFSLIRTSAGVSAVFDELNITHEHYHANEKDLATIIYTSGTTGFSKGVMLSQKNIISNAYAAGKIQPMSINDRLLSILPLSHTYENTLGLILPLLNGSCVYYLTKPPTVSVLLPALKTVKPTIMLSVPLIIEKIYKSSVLKKFQKTGFIRFLYGKTFFRKILHRIAGKKLMKVFGGELIFFGIGGAKLDPIVERFLIEAKFPYAIGYGLTETSPLLAGLGPKNVRHQSTGPVIENTELVIHNPDPLTGEGEIWAKGPGVMLGYYKDKKLTDEVITKEGWFRTGDLGVFDKEKYLYLKGRLKSLILGAGGENIYPEEIESVINSYNYVVESLVIDRKGKLVAMVHFNKEEIEQKYKSFKIEVSNLLEQKLEEMRSDLQQYVNNRVSKFSQLQAIVITHEPFTKTATQKIKRYLYH